MEVYITRDEIIRRAKARLGFTTNAAQAPMIGPEFEELARAAALHVYHSYDWANLLRDTRVSLGIDQVVINYPANAGVEDILEISYWDGDRYIPLSHRYIPNSLTDDPKLDEGEPASVAGRGAPRYFQCKEQIQIAPRPDKAYGLKVRHTVTPDLASGADVCVVDGELIILLMIAWKRSDMGDDRLAEKAEERYEDRRMALARKQAPTSSVVRGSLRHARMNVRNVHVGYIPTSGQWPAVMP